MKNWKTSIVSESSLNEGDEERGLYVLVMWHNDDVCELYYRDKNPVLKIYGNAPEDYEMPLDEFIEAVQEAKKN